MEIIFIVLKKLYITLITATGKQSESYVLFFAIWEVILKAFNICCGGTTVVDYKLFEFFAVVFNFACEINLQNLHAVQLGCFRLSEFDVNM